MSARIAGGSTAAGAGGENGAENEEGLEGVPAWPPTEAAGPSAGRGAGPCVGSAGWTGDGASEDAVVLAATAAVAEGKEEAGGSGAGGTLGAVPSRHGGGGLKNQ